MAGRDDLMTKLPEIREDEALYVELDVRSLGLTDDQFLQLCSDNPELNFELSAERELIVMSLPGGKTGWRNAIITHGLVAWAIPSSSMAGLCSRVSGSTFRKSSDRGRT